MRIPATRHGATTTSRSALRPRFSRSVCWHALAAVATFTALACSGDSALPPSAAVTTIEIVPGSAALVQGDSVRLSATVRDQFGVTMTGQSINWSSAATAIATVSAQGTVTAIAGGTTTITAAAGTKSASVGVNVTARVVTTITLSTVTVSLIQGDTSRIVATLRDQLGAVMSGVVVVWTSSASNVATVSSVGTVTALAPGVATITATAGGKSATAQANVAARVTTLTVLPTSATLAQGDTTRLVATPRDASGGVITGRQPTWTSSASAVATVAATGTVTALAAGSATITATLDGKTATVALTVLTRVVLETARAVSATIGSAGGTISATSTAGVVYNFVVPPLVLDSGVRITVTPVSRIGKLPFSREFVGGVDFQPSGLKFGPGALLIITPSSPVPALGPNARVFGFTFERSVDSITVQPASVRNGGFAISIEHFSFGGFAVGNVSDLSTLPIVPNGSILQQRAAQLASLVLPQDLNATIAIFKAWRTQVEAIMNTAQSGVEAKISIDLFLNWTTTLEALAGSFGTAGQALQTALAGDRSALVVTTQNAMKRGIATLNQQCIRISNLLDAENVLFLTGYAGALAGTTELTGVGSGLESEVQLAGLCIQPVQSFASFPAVFVPNTSATLDLTYGVKFGANPVLNGAFFNVTLAVSGAGSNGTSTILTDAGGRTLPRQIATTITPITVQVKSCLGPSQAGFNANLQFIREVCHFSTLLSEPPEVLSTSGSVFKDVQPASVRPNILEGDLITRFFRERETTLGSQVRADVVVPGTYRDSFSPGFIPAGTSVITYMLHADPVGVQPSTRLLSGSVTFSHDILGIIFSPSALDATDLSLGAPGTVYPTGVIARDAGVEPGSTDADEVGLSVDRRTVTFTMETFRLGQIRVVLRK